MIAKMPMTGSPEEGRDCIAQLPLRSLIFDTRVKLRHYADQLNFLFNLGRHTDPHGKRPSQRYLDYRRSRANLALEKCWAPQRYLAHLYSIRLFFPDHRPVVQRIEQRQFLTSFSGNCGAKFWKNFLPSWRLRSAATNTQGEMS